MAVCIAERDAGRLSRAMYYYKRELLGEMHLRKKEEELKAVVFLDRRNITRCAPKRRFTDTLFDDVLARFPLTVFGIVMERPHRTPVQDGRSLATQYRWLLERIEMHCEQTGPDEYATVIFDDMDPGSNAAFSSTFGAWMARTSAGRAMKRIVPTPLFVDSCLTPGIQIADWFAYVIRLNYEYELWTLPARALAGDEYLATIARYARIARAKTMDFVRDDGSLYYGITTMDSGKFDYGVAADEPVFDSGAQILAELRGGASPKSSSAGPRDGKFYTAGLARQEKTE
jgi:hypothetical protein